LNLKKIDAKTSPIFHHFFVHKTQINAYRKSKSMT